MASVIRSVYDPVRRFLDTPGHSGISPRKHLIVFSLYLILAVLYTYPLARNLSTHIPGQHAVLHEHSDEALVTWYPWWFRKALFSAEESILYSNWVYYPVGMEMTMQPAMFLHGAMTVPLFWMDITTANNVVIIVSFALSGLSAFLLGLYVCKSLPGAFFCGFVYAFCPIKFQHIVGHYHLMSTETLPLVALSLIRLYDRSSVRHVVWAGVWLGITVFTDYYYFAYALLLFGYIAAYRTLTSKSRLPTLRNTVLVGVVAFVIASPLLVPALISASNSSYALAGGHENHKADLLSPFVPSERQWLFRPLMPFLEEFVDMDKVDGVEHSIYVGWPLLMLCIAYARRIGSVAGHARLFLLLTVCFFILALGPHLGINGRDTFGESEWRIPMPALLLMDLPFFEGARAPSRVFIIATVGLAVCAGCGIRQLLASGKKWGLQPVLWAIVVVAITAIEYVIPIGLSEILITQGLRDIGSDPEPGIVVHVPMTPTRSAFWQPLWGRKMTMISLGRVDPEVSQYYWRHDAIRFLNLPYYVGGVPSPEDARHLIDLLGIRYVILDRTAFEPEKLEPVWNVLDTVYGMDEVYVDEFSNIFRVPGHLRVANALKFRLSDPKSELHLPYGWSNRTIYNEAIVTWMIGKRAQIALPPVAANDYLLNLDTVVLAEEPQHLRVTTGKTELGRFTLTPGKNRLAIQIERGTLLSGETNLIELTPSGRLGLPYTTGLGLHPRPHGTPIEVRSGGFFTPGVGSAEIVVGDVRMSIRKRGLLVAIIDTSGQIEAEHFAVGEKDTGVDSLEAYIKSAPKSATVAIASRMENNLHGGNIGQALRWIGFPDEVPLSPLNSLAVIGGRDGRVPVFSTGPAVTRIGTGRHAKSSDAAIGLLGLELILR